MDLNRILREGFIAGCIGAAAVAIWFLIVDVINGQPLFTPAMLGSAVFWGATGSEHVIIEPARIFGYTMIHVSAFVVVGCVAAHDDEGADVNHRIPEDAGGLDDDVLRACRSPEYRTPEHGGGEERLAVDEVHDEKPDGDGRRPDASSDEALAQNA